MAKLKGPRVCLDITYFTEIENWKHCNKINFKCVNSTVVPIFNEKVVEKWDLWVSWLKSWLKGAGKVVEVCTVHTILRQQSRHREKKKAETRESPDVNAKRRNNPIQTHTKLHFLSLDMLWALPLERFFIGHYPSPTSS